MNKILYFLIAALLFSGCVLVPDKSSDDKPANLRVSGDVTISAVDRK